MPRGRVRAIYAEEADLWLGILLGASFDPTSHTLNLARSAELINQRKADAALKDYIKVTARDGRQELLALASDFTTYPEDYNASRRAEMLLRWANLWLQADDWNRLQAKVRKRREKLNKEITN